MTRVVMVAEAWGQRESEAQHPLVGPSGRELSLQIGTSGLGPFMKCECNGCKRKSRYIKPRCEFCEAPIWPSSNDCVAYWQQLRIENDIHVTNVFNAQPPGNDLGHFFTTEPETNIGVIRWKASKTSSASFLKAEFAHHVESLWANLRELQPNLVVAMGNASCWALLDKVGIFNIRGTVNWSPRLGLKVLPTFHPAAVLRQVPMRVSTIADMRKATRERNFPEIRRPPRWIYIVDPDEDGLKRAYDWFKEPAAAYAMDIETFRGQITMVGFARSRSDALVIPFRIKSLNPNWWPTAELEVAAWRLLRFGCKSSQPKIFQNGVYDLSYLIRAGMWVNNARHDTMLWSHSEYPELPKGLGYLASIYCDDIAWKTMVQHGNAFKRDE